jgi:tRNA(Ile)-lysidine synthase
MNDSLCARHLEKIKSVVIGVSGGPDSLCLLDLARQIPTLKIIVANFNHGLRPEADQEAEVVGRVAARMQLSFVGEAGDVRGFAKEEKLSLEEAARILGIDPYSQSPEQKRRMPLRWVTLPTTRSRPS